MFVTANYHVCNAAGMTVAGLVIVGLLEVLFRIRSQFCCCVLYFLDVIVLGTWVLTHNFLITGQKNEVARPARLRF